MPISNLRLHSNALVTNCNNFGKNLLQGELFEIIIESKISEKCLFTQILMKPKCEKVVKRFLFKTL